MCSFVHLFDEVFIFHYIFQFRATSHYLVHCLRFFKNVSDRSWVEIACWIENVEVELKSLPHGIFADEGGLSAHTHTKKNVEAWIKSALNYRQLSLIHYNCSETVVLFSIIMRRLSSKVHKGQFSDTFWGNILVR